MRLPHRVRWVGLRFLSVLSLSFLIGLGSTRRGLQTSQTRGLRQSLCVADSKRAELGDMPALDVLRFLRPNAYLGVPGSEPQSYRSRPAKVGQIVVDSFRCMEDFRGMAYTVRNDFGGVGDVGQFSQGRGRAVAVVACLVVPCWQRWYVPSDVDLRRELVNVLS